MSSQLEKSSFGRYVSSHVDPLPEASLLDKSSFGRYQPSETAPAPPMQNWEIYREQYLKDIEQYKGTPYYEQLLNNPFLPNGTEYTPSWFEKQIKGYWFNDWSGTENFYSDLIRSADEEKYKILGQMQQDKMNSASAQVARENAAGVNPDLAGISGEPASGSPGTDETSPSASEASAANNQRFDAFLEQIPQVGLQFFQNMISLPQYIQQFKGMNLDNMMKDLQVTGSAYDQTLEMLAGMLNFTGSPDEVDKLTKGQADIMNDSIAIALKELPDTFSLHMTKPVRKLMKGLRGKVAYDKDGKPTLAYQTFRNKLISDMLSNKSTSAKILSDPMYSDDVLGFASNIAEKFTKIEQEVESLRLKYQKEYLDKLDPQSAAGAENAQNGYTSDYYGVSGEHGSLGKVTGENDYEAAVYAKQKQELDNIIDTVFGEINQDIEADIKKKKETRWYHYLAKLLLSGGRFLLKRLSSAQFSGSSSVKRESPFGSSGSLFNFGF